MTYKRLRPGGGGGVFCHGSDRIGSVRNSFGGKGLRVPASVPVMFTILVDIPGRRVFPGLAFPMHLPLPLFICTLSIPSR